MFSLGGSCVSWDTMEQALEFNRRINNSCTLVFSMGITKRYMLMTDRGSIAHMHPELCLCEMVVDDTGRPFVDFDHDVEECIDEISCNLRQYFSSQYNANVVVRWKWSYHHHKRWHCIVSGVYFRRCWKHGCISMVEYLQQQIPALLLDSSVYRNNSCLRMVMQYKLQDGVYMKRLYPHVADRADRFSINGNGEDMALHTRSSDTGSQAAEHRLRMLDTGTYFCIPDGYRLGPVVHRDEQVVARLNRMYPSVCILCKRIHHNDNATITVSKENVIFRCYRNTREVLLFKS